MGDCFEFVQQDFAQIARVFGCVGLRVDQAGRPARRVRRRAQVRWAGRDRRALGPFGALAPIPWMPN